MLMRKSIRGEAFSHGNFIPSIEGMRALAVLVVLFFHLDITGFDGGFLGVDLFFVISGFIITRNILSDLHGGTFFLKEFYVRRFRRLFPALLVTVLVTVVVAVVIVPPVELVNTAKSAIFALFSLANFNFWLESGYFDAAANTKPLLHTWSLSVEEQFYLFWPALVLVLANTWRRMLVAAVLLSFSLGSALIWRNSFPNAIFFLLPFRLHQLMAGALIAILALRLGNNRGNICTLLASAGFVALSILLNSGHSPAVGAAAVTGLGFLLLLGRETVIAKVLYGNKPMQWIGQRSYAIYLVHWPIIVLYKYYTDFQLDNAARFLLFVISICFAVGLHELVEKPFRKRGRDTTICQRIAIPVTISTLLVTVLISVVIWRLHGLPSRVDPRILKIVNSVDSEVDQRRRAIRFGRCNLHETHQFSAYDTRECASLDPSRKNVLILGDSMAADTYMMLSQTYPEIQFSQATAGACTAILKISDIGGKYPTCEALNEYRFSKLVELDMNLIVLASIWSEDRIQPLKETVAYLRSKGKKVLVIGPRAHFHGAIPLLISREASLDVVNERLRDRVIQDTALLNKMRAAMPDVEILDIGAIQCGLDCNVVEGDRLLYIDERHFTKLGAKRIGDRLRASFDLPGFIESRTTEDALKK
jgi:peptidoglycan/LPS O-acetylase OafA/YrhL